MTGNNHFLKCLKKKLSIFFTNFWNTISLYPHICTIWLFGITTTIASNRITTWCNTDSSSDTCYKPTWSGVRANSLADWFVYSRNSTGFTFTRSFLCWCLQKGFTSVGVVRLGLWGSHLSRAFYRLPDAVSVPSGQRE